MGTKNILFIFRERCKKIKRKLIYNFKLKLGKRANLFPSKFYMYINNKRNHEKWTVNEIVMNKVKYMSKKEIETEFNKFFISVFNKNNMWLKFD